MCALGWIFGIVLHKHHFRLFLGIVVEESASPDSGTTLTRVAVLLRVLAQGMLEKLDMVQCLVFGVSDPVYEIFYGRGGCIRGGGVRAASACGDRPIRSPAPL